MGAEASRISADQLPDYFVDKPDPDIRKVMMLETSLKKLVYGGTDMEKSLHENRNKRLPFTNFYIVFFTRLRELESDPDDESWIISEFFENDIEQQCVFLVRLMKLIVAAPRNFILSRGGKWGGRGRKDLKKFVHDYWGLTFHSFDFIGQALFDAVEECANTLSEKTRLVWVEAYSILLAQIIPLISSQSNTLKDPSTLPTHKLPSGVGGGGGSGSEKTAKSPRFFLPSPKTFMNSLRPTTLPSSRPTKSNSTSDISSCRTPVTPMPTRRSKTPKGKKLRPKPRPISILNPDLQSRGRKTSRASSRTSSRTSSRASTPRRAASQPPTPRKRKLSLSYSVWSQQYDHEHTSEEEDDAHENNDARENLLFRQPLDPRTQTQMKLSISLPIAEKPATLPTKPSGGSPWDAMTTHRRRLLTNPDLSNIPRTYPEQKPTRRPTEDDLTTTLRPRSSASLESSRSASPNSSVNSSRRSSTNSLESTISPPRFNPVFSVKGARNLAKIELPKDMTLKEVFETARCEQKKTRSLSWDGDSKGRPEQTSHTTLSSKSPLLMKRSASEQDIEHKKILSRSAKKQDI